MSTSTAQTASGGNGGATTATTHASAAIHPLLRKTTDKHTGNKMGTSAHRWHAHNSRDRKAANSPRPRPTSQPHPPPYIGKAKQGPPVPKTGRDLPYTMTHHLPLPHTSCGTWQEGAAPTALPASQQAGRGAGGGAGRSAWAPQTCRMLAERLPMLLRPPFTPRHADLLLPHEHSTHLAPQRVMRVG